MRVFKKKVLLKNPPWRNKKRRRRERSRDDKPQLNHIPLDLTLEILSRLPWKSIMRYRCVSKQWYSITTLPSFINSFTSRSTSRSPTLLVTFASGSEKYVFSFPQHQIPNGSTCSPFYSDQITNLDWKDSRSDSVHGLILSHVLKIWNPTLKKFLALPQPNKCSSSCNGWRSGNACCVSYLGYDPLEGKHKVLFMSRLGYWDHPLILTLGGQESWRIITKGRCPMHYPTGGYGRCFNGILYYRARLLRDRHIIMSFDVQSEYFNIINYPVEVDGPVSSYHMIHYEGRLALASYKYPYDNVRLFILEDAHGHKWTRECFVLRLPYESLPKYSIDFRGTTDAGEFVFASYDFSETFYILYFDPRRKNARKVFLERNKGDLRRRCGLDSKGKFAMEVFPNHIESLFSL